MSSFVVDTNVAIVANGEAEQAGPQCVLACVEAMEVIVRGGTIVLDTGMRILDEYRDHLSMRGQPGVGDAFMKWVWSVQGVPEQCEQVAITPIPSERMFEEFPDDPDLSGFDRSDRKFVAAALASASGPEVLNAVDSDWWNYRQPLERHGVKIGFLCPEQFADR